MQTSEDGGLVAAVLTASRHVFVLSMVLIFCIGLLLVTVGASSVDEHKKIAEILHEVGHAIMVAAILGLTVDAYSKKRHEILADSVTRRINTDVLGAVYGQQFPAKIRSEVQKNFLEQRIHREDLNITYSFEALSNNADRLVVKEQSSFRFVNTSDQPVQMDLKTYVECPLSPDLRAFCKILEYTVNGVAYSEEELKGVFTDDGMELRWKKGIVIPAKGSVEVTSACQTIKFSRDVEIWSSLYPSDGITLNVSLDLPLNVFARCNNSGTLKQEVDQKHFKRWRLDNGLFPGQSMTFWWSPPDVKGGEV